MAKIPPGLRASTRPRDLLGRVQVVLLAFALANLVGALIVAVASASGPLPLYLAGLAAPPTLALVWLSVYARRDFSIVEDCAAIAAVCVFAIAVDARWSSDVVAVLTAAVFFGSAYGSLRRVLLRTSLMSAVAVGQSLADTASFTVACAFVVAFVIFAFLMHGMVSSISRYERTAQRQHILAAAGLDLVAAADMPSIAAAAVEGALALCAGAPDVRASMAVAGPAASLPRTYKVLCAAGRLASEISNADLDARQLCAEGEELADQRSWRIDAEECGNLLPGQVLATRVSVAGATRAVVILESTDRIADELAPAIRALATQASLAIDRADLQSAAAARESNERFQALVQSSTDVISIVSPDGHVLYQSPSVTAVFGYEPDGLLGMAIGTLVHPEDEERVTADFRGVATHPGQSCVSECRVRHSDGSWRYTDTHMNNLLKVQAVNGIVLNTRDVTDRHSLEAELRFQAYHDPLTGLANRVLFSKVIEQTLEAAKKDGSTVAVLCCAMDGVDRLNDGFGYRSGDAALTVIADRLRTCVRGQDTVARLASNEFGLMLDHLTSPADATIAMERIMAVLREPLELPGASIELQPHTGIAVTVAGEDSAEDLLRNSALAVRSARLYEGGYALFDPEMHADAIRKIEVESQLRTAIEQGQFVLYYQPTILLQTGRLTGVEALVRWQHPRRGIVPPLEFIPLAEECGLIIPLGQWAIQEACRQARIWQKEIPADEPMALNVNLSARQLHHPTLVRDIADALDDSGLMPSRLILEITESVLMIDTAATLSRLFQLKSLGVRLAVDDFGTGYSSFAYLRRFPFDILKIDKSFVDGVATEPTASALVDAMIRVGKTLRLETVAEGVERTEQADQLRSLQCDIGQGYLFSRPLPSEAIAPYLRDRSSGHQANAA